MKSLIIAGAVALATLGTATAASAHTDNPKACFGQDRAAWIAAHSGAEAGEIISGRAHDGTNAQINADYKAACQAA